MLSFKLKSVSTAVLVASASLLALSAFAQDAKKPFTYQDMISLDRISGLNVDASGQYAVFQVRATDLDKNKGVTSVWLKDLSKPTSPEVRLAISDGGANTPKFSGDGKSIYYLSSKSGSTQVWKTDLTGAAGTQVTKLALDVGSYQLTPDGKGVVVSMAVYPECKGNEIDCTVKTAADKKTQKSTGVIYDKLFVRHWDEWADGTRNHLFYQSFDGAAPVSLTDGYDGDVPSKPFGDEAEYTISPDSKTVFFSAREAGKTEPWSTNFDLYSVPLDGSVAPANHTAANKAWDTSPRLSPDGKTLAYKAMKRPGFEADRFEIQLQDANGKVTPLAADWDRSVDDMKWSKDGKSIYVTAGDVGLGRLFRIDVKTGKVTALSQGGHIDAFEETKGGFVFLKSALNSPSQLYASNPKAMFIDMGARNLTSVNKAVLDKTEFGQYEQFNFKGWNDEIVHGYVVKPAGYVEGQTYPVAFLIHGGPQGSFGDSWSYRWNPETYAGAGFAVVMIDFHGSTGYGQAFTDAISEHWGSRPLEDLQKGWAFALGKYKFLDGDRACALGASYGGYMINWIAGNWKEPQGTKGWKCLVNHDGIFDTRTMAEETEELWFSEWENGGVPYTNMAKMDEFNPALHAKNWSVPELVIHSDKDYRVVPGQGIATFTALQRQGIESKFLRFPDENHWVLKPQNSLMWHDTVFDWIKTHTAKDAK